MASLTTADAIYLGGAPVSRAYLGATQIWPWTPVALFALGEQGGCYDLSDLSTLWQDAGRTIPAVLGQPVIVADDISGNGHHVTLTAAVLQQDAGGRYRVGFDGSSSSGVTAAFAAGSDKATIVAGIQLNTLGATVVRFGTGDSEAGSFDVGLNGGGLTTYRTASVSWGARISSSAGSGQNVLTSQLDLAGTTPGTENAGVRVNGLQASVITNYGAGDSGSGNFGTYALTIGDGKGRFDGGLYALIVRFAATSSEGIEAAETWCAVRTGATLFTPPPLVFADTGAEISRVDYVETSPYARAVFTTDATQVTISAYSNIYSDYPQFAELGLVVNGVYDRSIVMTAQGANSSTINLAAGSKTIELVNGLQARPVTSAPPIGTFFVSVTAANLPVVAVAPAAATGRVVFYGDSIAVGGNAGTPTDQSFVMRIRKAYTGSVAVEAYGSRALKLDAVDIDARAGFVAKLRAYGPARIWLAIGTNDFGLNYWSAADFGAAYGALLDKLHAEMPAVALYAQTPFTRDSTGVNIFANTLADYRAAIVTAHDSRAAWSTLVDGTALVTLAELADGVHPTSAGHATIATNIQAILGI